MLLTMRPKMHRMIRILALALAPLANINAAEVPQHGLVFEKWVRDTFFEGYAPPDYTQKWDIPAPINKNHGGYPVNPKVIKYRRSVDLDDALRQYDIHETFILVIGYWQQEAAEITFRQSRGTRHQIGVDKRALERYYPERSRTPRCTH